jgi:hypothetical protein
MKITPFGFVCRAETFVKDALSMPPRGGGEWSTQRLVNFVDHTGTLQILIDPGTGVAKPSAIIHSRSTGSPRDSGVQGWVEYPSTDSREAFALRASDADRAIEEIFDIVERMLSKIPEWDSSTSFQRPEPPPRVFEPLIPEIQKTDSDTVATEESSAGPIMSASEFPDAQSMVDSLLSPDNFDKGPVETPEPASEPEAPAEAVVEEPAAAEEPEKPAKKAARGRKPKA